MGEGGQQEVGPRPQHQLLQQQTPHHHGQQETQQQNASPLDELFDQQQLLSHRIFDRQIRLWGVEAQKRLLSTRLLVVGLTGINVELLKNMALAGVHATLCDDRPTSSADLSFNFLLSYSNSSHTTVAAESLRALQAMAPLRQCSCLSEAVFAAAAAQAAAGAATGAGPTAGTASARAEGGAATRAAGPGAGGEGEREATTAAAGRGEREEATAGTAAATAAGRTAGAENLEKVLQEFTVVCVAAEFYPLPVLAAIDAACRKLNIGFCFSHCSGKMGFSFADFHKHQFRVQQQRQPSGAAAGGAATDGAADVATAAEGKAVAAAVVEEEAAAAEKKPRYARTAEAAADTGKEATPAPAGAEEREAAAGKGAAAEKGEEAGGGARPAAESPRCDAAAFKEKVYPSLLDALTCNLGDSDRRVDRGLLAYVALLRWLGEKENFQRRRGIAAPRYVFEEEDFCFAAFAETLLSSRSKAENGKTREKEEEGRESKRARSESAATVHALRPAPAAAAAAPRDPLLPCMSMMAGCQYTPTAAVVGGLLAQELRKYITREQEPLPNCILFNFDSSTASTAMLPSTFAAAAVARATRAHPAAIAVTAEAAVRLAAAAAAGRGGSAAAGTVM